MDDGFGCGMISGVCLMFLVFMCGGPCNDSKPKDELIQVSGEPDHEWLPDTDLNTVKDEPPKPKLVNSVDGRNLYEVDAGWHTCYVLISPTGNAMACP